MRRIESVSKKGEQFSKIFWQDMVEGVNSSTQYLVFLCDTYSHFHLEVDQYYKDSLKVSKYKYAWSIFLFLVSILLQLSIYLYVSPQDP